MILKELNVREANFFVSQYFLCHKVHVPSGSLFTMCPMVSIVHYEYCHPYM